MPYIIFCLVALLILFVYFLRLSDFHFTVGHYLVLVYIVSCSLSLLLPLENFVFSLRATAIFLLSLFLYLLPVGRFTRKKLVLLNEQGNRFLKLFFVSLSVISIIGIILYLPTVYRLFFSGESLLSLRTSMVGGENYRQQGIVYSFFDFISQFYPVQIAFYFYSRCFLQTKKWFNSLIFIGSTLYIVNVLTVVGRDGFVLWGMSFLFSLIMFYRFLPIKRRRNILLLSVTLFSVFLVPLLAITESRFEGTDLGTIGSIGSYGGQSFCHFNDFVSTIEKPENYGSLVNIFPILRHFSMVEAKGSVSFVEEWETKTFFYGKDVNVFSSFLGSIFLNVGVSGLLLISFFSFLIGIFLFRRRTIIVADLFNLTVFSQLILHGIFYLKMAYTVSNLYVVFVILFFSVLRRYQRRDVSIIYW